MQTPPADSASASRQLHPIRCPYCDHTFDISRRAEDGTLLPIEGAELQVLPYARDVEIFDPDPKKQGKHNSEWTRIGKDFFAGVNYESIGILHMEKGWDVRYCVARCPHCQGLIDVFANLTDGTSLAEMWPHLLASDPDDPPDGIKPWEPMSIASRVFDHTFFVWLFFIVLYVGPLTPQIMFYAHQPLFDANHFLAQTPPVLLIRGIMVVALGYLVLHRRKMIALFRDTSALAELLKVNKKGLIYWSNFAVSRFTGYQKAGSWVTKNAVMLIGGVLSSIILFVAWLIVRFMFPATTPSPDIAVMATELLFWLIVSYGFGIIAWNFSVIPVYVLRQVKNIPINVDHWDFEQATVIERGRGYSDRGIYALLMSAIALSMFPVFTTGFDEVRWAIIWAQSALIVCFAIIIIRLNVTTAKDQLGKVMGTTEVIVILLVYLAVRYGIGISQADGPIMHIAAWLGITEVSAVKQYAELMVFSVLAAYLFSSLAYGKKAMVRDIRTSAIRDSYRERLKAAQAANNLDEENKLVKQREKKIRMINKREKKVSATVMTMLVPIIPAAIAALVTQLITHLLPGIR